MKEATKAEFKKLYFKHGGGEATGWGCDYWDRFFEDEERAGMRYMVEEPKSAEHTRMMIVVDGGAKEYRMFFLTDEEDDHFLEFPEL